MDKTTKLHAKIIIQKTVDTLYALINIRLAF